MKLAQKKIALLIVAGIVYLGGQFFRGVWFINLPVNLCGNAFDDSGRFCNSPYIGTIGWPLIEIGIILLLAAAIMLFASASVLDRWLKLNMWALPALVAVFAFVTISFPPTGFMALDPLQTIRFLGYYIYLPLTVLVLASGYFFKIKP